MKEILISNIMPVKKTKTGRINGNLSFLYLK
jgi:hypothetical protein